MAKSKKPTISPEPSIATAPAEEKNKGGRPPVEYDAQMIEKLASIHCTVEEIALVMGCSKDTLERRYMAVMELGRAKGKSSIRRIQYEQAQKGNSTMLVWLGKQLLGQKDVSRIELDKVPDDALAVEVERRLKLVPSS